MDNAQYQDIMNRFDILEAELKGFLHGPSVNYGWDEGVKHWAGFLLGQIDSGWTLDQVRESLEYTYKQKCEVLNDG